MWQQDKTSGSWLLVVRQLLCHSQLTCDVSCMQVVAELLVTAGSGLQGRCQSVQLCNKSLLTRPV